MKVFYWGIMDSNRKMPSYLYTRFGDAKSGVHSLNNAVQAPKDKPRFRVKRFLLELKRGAIIDVFEHERITTKK